MQELTITRALIELTVTRKRINSLTQSTTFISTRVNGDSWKDNLHETKSNWQSINDLTKNYLKLKFAIIKSNSTVKIKIADKEYTLAEAIAVKEFLNDRKFLLDTLKDQRTRIVQQVESHNSFIRQKLDKLLELNFQKDKKVDENEIKIISESYMKNNRIEVIDPLSLDKEISLLEEEISLFERELNFVLSESNAITKINL